MSFSEFFVFPPKPFQTAGKGLIAWFCISGVTRAPLARRSKKFTDNAEGVIDSRKHQQPVSYKSLWTMGKTNKEKKCSVTELFGSLVISGSGPDNSHSQQNQGWAELISVVVKCCQPLIKTNGIQPLLNFTLLSQPLHSLISPPLSQLLSHTHTRTLKWKCCKVWEAGRATIPAQ